MCGIAGVVTYDAPLDNPEQMARALDAALSHRGPDGSGRLVSPRGDALLVHRRLAIIDPSAAAAQPMSSPDGRYTLIFNGEIYNYRELRASAPGPLRTASDTEVVLQLVAAHGPDALPQLRGMFAFALWDDASRSLLLARDRFGIRPLYVAARPATVAFASEIGALRRAGLVERRVSHTGVLAYLSWASIPAPLTWLEGVEHLEAGTWMRVSPEGTTRGRFADVSHAFATNGSAPLGEAELRERAAAAIADTVRAHLVADVPVGIFLSGGVDSGAIVSTARALNVDDLHTYTVVVDDDRLSEETHALATARKFDTTHHTLRLRASTLIEDLPAIIQRLDQPTADAVNTYYVSRAVAATGVKAVLSGVGGDEMFCGYPSFRRLPAALRAGAVFGGGLRMTRPAAAAVLPAWRAAKWAHFAANPSLAGGYRALRGYFMPAELEMMCGDALHDVRGAHDQLAHVEARWLAGGEAETPLASVARLETRGFLGAQLLRDVDAVSMAHGLEVRVPFVDHELLASVWPALGAHPSLARRKRLLRESVARPLPAAIADAPKRGFTLPFDAWMRGRLADVTRDGLSTLARERWITPAAADAVWTSWARGEAHWSRVWGLSVLGRFLAEAP